MIICRMRIACWIPKATNAHTFSVILIAFPLQKCLHERTSVLRYVLIACPVQYSLFMDRELNLRLLDYEAEALLTRR